MNVARTTYRAALVAAALSCLGYASLAHADRDDWRGDRRWTEERGADRYDRRWDGRGDDRRYDRRGDRHWNGPRHGYDGWRWAPPPRYWRPPPAYYYAPPPRYRPWPGAYAYPRYHGGWRGTGYYDSRGRWCDDGDVSLTIRIPF